MPHHTTPWYIDPALTQRGVGPVGHGPTREPAPADPARYRLGSRLDGTGQVYEAQNSRYAGRLVVKLFPFAATLAPAAVGAFTREAGRVADLRHPHIAQVIHAGVFADGTPFAAMERLFGQTLDQRIADSGALPVSEVLPLVRGIASALSAAHAVGVVHREVRADNIFVAYMAGYEHGFAKLLDFGVSRLTSAARAAGRIVGPGTLRALAPEQGQGTGAGTGAGTGDRADERTDQYALSALTYRLLTGAEPPAGQDAGPAFERVRENQHGASGGFVRCAPAVEAVLNKAMSKRPENRFDSVALFFYAIREALTGKAPPPTPLPVSHDAPTVLLSVPQPALVVGTGEGPATSAPAVPAGAGADHVDVSSPTMRATVAPVASLTQQFFVEGDRQEASQWAKAAILEEDDALDEDGISDDAHDRVPKRRAPLIAAVILVGLGIAAWATDLWSPFAWFSSGAEKSGPAVAAPPPTVAPPAPSAATVTPDRVAAAAIPPVPAPATVSPARADPPPSARPPPPAAGAPALPSVARSVSAAHERKAPLRGYAWSADGRRLVRVRAAPLSTESPPPPAFSLPPPPSVDPGSLPPTFSPPPAPADPVSPLSIPSPPPSPDSLLPPADPTLMVPADSTLPAPPPSPPSPPAESVPP